MPNSSIDVKKSLEICQVAKKFPPNITVNSDTLLFQNYVWALSDFSPFNRDFNTLSYNEYKTHRKGFHIPVNSNSHRDDYISKLLELEYFDNEIGERNIVLIVQNSTHFNVSSSVA